MASPSASCLAKAKFSTWTRRWAWRTPFSGQPGADVREQALESTRWVGIGEESSRIAVLRGATHTSDHVRKICGEVRVTRRASENVRARGAEVKNCLNTHSTAPCVPAQSLPASRTCHQFRGLDLKCIRDPPEHGDRHRRLRSLNLTNIACAQPNPIGQVLLRPSTVMTEPTDIDRYDLLEVGHGASGRYRHDPSRNDAS
jgi:hypothetical protein